MWELTLGDEIIEPQYINPPIVFSTGPRPVHFRLTAIEDVGKKLSEKLKQLEKDGPIKFHARGENPFSNHDTVLDGLCTIVDLSVESDQSKTPVIYRISGSLELVR